jgi:hypothetical protein
MVAAITVSLSLTLSSAFLLRAAVVAASKLGGTYCEPSPPSKTLGLTLIVVLFTPPALALPLVTICHSAPPPPSDPASAAAPAATAGVEL